MVSAEGPRLSARTSNGVDETLAALAEPTRRKIVELLIRRPWRSSELADALSLSRPAMSRHLRVLRHAGVVAEASLHEDARAKVYRLRPESLLPLRTWLEALTSWVDHTEPGSR